MSPERWQEINELFLAALERDTYERVAFINEASPGDEELRREVESLLASHEAASQFIEEPVVAEAARLLSDDYRQSMVGQHIGHYRILTLLGSGGMGEVYLAEDSQLGRKVAIKILPVQFSKDRDRVRRLQQEARTASALNHPNILTIHEIGEIEGRHFIATEFIDGETLRTRLDKGGLTLSDALDLTCQIANALVKSHGAGITHRDIKPDNLMINRDGYIKVLDFGLAKLTERSSSKVETEAPTKALVSTEPGMVMGTANYMSPEQARGSVVDARTDLWSLGVVLYQMLSGRLPFEGVTPTEVIARVLEREPLSLREYVPDLPHESQRIVEKALTKDREARYQTATEMLTDLKNLRQQFESGQLKPTSEAGNDVSQRVIVAPQATTAASVTTDEARAANATPSAEYVVTAIKRHKTGVMVALAVVVVGVAGLGWGLYKLIQNRSGNRPSSSFEKMKVTRLTTAGKIQSEPAISPDGKYVAYAILDGDKKSLWITHLATNSNVQIVPPGDSSFYAVKFSPDGNYVYYHLRRDDKRGLAVYQIPVLGGASKKLIDNVSSDITFSPDAKRFAFTRDEEDESVIMIANADGAGEERLALRKKMGGAQFYLPAWSPDGTVIACPSNRRDSFGLVSEIVLVRVSDGKETAITLPQDLRSTQFISWLTDGSGLLITATNGGINQDMNFFNQVWLISYPSGEAHRVTNDLNSYAGLSLTADGRTLVTAQSEYRSSIWVAPNNDLNHSKQIIPGGYDGVMGLSWTPDGRIVYAAMTAGKWDLFVSNSDGTNRRQLTSSPGNNVIPAVTPDGRYVVYDSDERGAYNLWRMDLDGNNVKQLTFGTGETFPEFTPDGEWILYRDLNFGRATISKVSINGGDPIKVFNGKWMTWIAASPDGKQIAYVSPDSKSRGTLYVSPSNDISAAKELFKLGGHLVWSPDGKALTYQTFFNDLGTTISKVWSQPLDGGEPRILFDASPDHIFYYDWSRDGKQIAFARGSMTQDIVLISNFH